MSLKRISHVVEPRFPAAVGRYVDLGRFYDLTAAKLSATEVKAHTYAYKRAYERAYRYLEHLLIPGLGLAFVTSRPGMEYPGKPFRRIHLDALAEPVEKGRQRLQSRLTVLLREEGVAALKAAKASHDALEAVYNPYVDFEGVRAQAALEAGRLLSWLEQ